MPGIRVKGQEVEIRITQNGAQIAALNNVKDGDFEFKLKKLQEGFLGATTDEYDEVFEGMDGKFTIQMSDAASFDLVKAIVDRARRVAGAINTRINIAANIRFPGAPQRRVYLMNCFFGAVPTNMPARDQYMTQTFEFSCSDFNFA